MSTLPSFLPSDADGEDRVLTQKAATPTGVCSVDEDCTQQHGIA